MACGKGCGQGQKQNSNRSQEWGRKKGKEKKEKNTTLTLYTGTVTSTVICKKNRGARALFWGEITLRGMLSAAQLGLSSVVRRTLWLSHLSFEQHRRTHSKKKVQLINRGQLLRDTNKDSHSSRTHWHTHTHTQQRTNMGCVLTSSNIIIEMSRFQVSVKKKKLFWGTTVHQPQKKCLSCDTLTAEDTATWTRAV